jgi:hypothetical protein
MFDQFVLGNLKNSIIEKNQSFVFKGPSLIGTICRRALATPTELWKLPMQTLQIRSDGGIAGAGFSSTEPVFADVYVGSVQANAGLAVTWEDFIAYGFDEKLNSFITQMSGLEEQYTNNQIAALVVLGGTALCSYDGLSFFNAAHPILPGSSTTFSNVVTPAVSLTATAFNALTPEIVSNAILEGYVNMTTRPQGDGGILGWLAPKYIICSVRMKRMVELALRAAYFNNTENVNKTVFGDIEVVASPHIDAIMGAAGITGTQTQRLYMIAEPNGDAAAFVEGTFIPFNLNIFGSAAQVIAPGIVRGFMIDYAGQLGYNYALPHYATQIL